MRVTNVSMEEARFLPPVERLYLAWYCLSADLFCTVHHVSSFWESRHLRTNLISQAVRNCPSFESSYIPLISITSGQCCSNSEDPVRSCSSWDLMTFEVNTAPIEPIARAKLRDPQLGVVK